ncbi:methyl-accepting chemotaxis protein [Gracilibacillus oryzae]|uniref:Methyl-accepting chemotaxis protein n=1 Tax=Gracilibacillus oryzae TaxID=1672701 RepID=A0A7C8GSA1_9BACI|nr:methyl-accepting chemotaxis protein [Gracilibacillus oryzae]KAB8128326.1 methyl-accepting chemotaxis protein [Gracilibacillus oryzae]
MKLKHQLGLITFIPIVIASIIIAIIAWQMTYIQSSNSENVEKLVEVEKFKNALIAVEQELTSFSLNRTDAVADSVLLKLEDAQLIFDRLSDVSNQAEKEQLKKIEQKLSPLIEEVLIAVEEKDSAEAKRQSIRTHGIQNDIYLLQLMIEQNYQKAQSDLKATVDSIMLFAIISALLLLIGTGIFSMMMTKRLVNPITLLTNFAGHIAKGDLTQILRKTSRKDEIGTLHNSFVQMREDLARLINSLMDTSQSVAASSEQLSANADEVSHTTEQISKTIQEVSIGSESQLDSVEEASSNVTSISEDIDSISERIKLVITSSDDATYHSTNGLEAVNRVNEQMDIINRNTEKTSSIIESLENHAVEINEIVSMITEIAEQTNLLALNASIEAAHAGEHGKGFAVVADEVRKLAVESNNSAKQINELIDKIQTTTKQAVNSMTRSYNAVKDGSTLVSKTNNAFDHITTSVESVRKRMDQVTASLGQVVSIKDKLISSIHHVSAITKETSSHSQEVARTTEEQTATIQEVSAATRTLADMAQELQEEISRFKI